MTGRHTADAKRGGHCSRVQRLARVSLGVIGGVLVLVLAATGYELALPGVGDAPLRVTSILRTHHGVAGGVPVPFRLGAAVVAIEDEHFYSNFLVNVFDGAARAALASLHTSSDPGGSTIAQQLAKQLYGEGSGLGTTLEGIGLGAKLSVSYSQAQVLAMYLNAVYYGNGYWGDVAAARGYFATSPDRLDWAEAAMLAGLPQAPSAYDPATHFALAKRRQGEVLQQLVVNHYLTAAQAAAAYRETLPMPSG
jgi:penicillin-binding protein 1A